jgi:SAM-dependent methyltransferase
MTPVTTAARVRSSSAHDDLEPVLRRLAEQYPPELRAQQVDDVPRMAFHIGLVRQRIPAGGRVCDLGGGVGLFSVGCAAAGLSAILVDDFDDPIAGYPPDRLLQLHRAQGVAVWQRDLMAGLDLEPDSLDAVTCFHSIEHWHHSPKRLFAQVMTALRPGGVFVLAGPNAVNLRKRISVPLGYGNWSALSEWYDADRFRGHVREPTLPDLRAIAARMGLADVTTFGRNWLGRSNRRRAIRMATGWVDPFLRLRSSLCSDIYVVGTKPIDVRRATA